MKKLIVIISLFVISFKVFAITLETNIVYMYMPKISIRQELPYNTFIKVTYSSIMVSSNLFGEGRWKYVSEAHFPLGINIGFYGDIFYENIFYFTGNIGVGVYTADLDYRKTFPAAELNIGMMLRLEKLDVGINTGITFAFVIQKNWFSLGNFMPFLDSGISFRF